MTLFNNQFRITKHFQAINMHFEGDLKTNDQCLKLCNVICAYRIIENEYHIKPLNGVLNTMLALARYFFSYFIKGQLPM